MTLVFDFSGSFAPALLVYPTILLRIPRSYSLLSFFPRSFRRALLRLPFTPYGPLLLLRFLRLPSFPRGSVRGFGTYLFFVSSFSGFFLPSFLHFLPRAAVSLSLFPILRILLAVLRYFWFSSEGGVFPFVCSFSISLWFLTRSDLRFPSGRVGFCSAFCPALFSKFLLVFLFFLVWFSHFPLPHSHLRFT